MSSCSPAWRRATPTSRRSNGAAMKTALGISGVIAILVVGHVVNNAYCSWRPDSVVGHVVKWIAWDPRTC